MTAPTIPSGRSRQGFASMGPVQHHAVSTKGGQLAHLKGTAHEYTPAEARVAGSKGGRETQRRRLARKAAGQA